MNTLEHSVVHRLPQSYRWCAGAQGKCVVAQACNRPPEDADLIGLRLLSHQGACAWDIMQSIQQALAGIELECAVIEWEGEPCLFVCRQDESTTTCRLKNFGVGIAEPYIH